MQVGKEILGGPPMMSQLVSACPSDSFSSLHCCCALSNTNVVQLHSLVHSTSHCPSERLSIFCINLASSWEVQLPTVTLRQFRVAGSVALLSPINGKR